MKKLNILLFIATLGVFTSCTDDFENINKNPNKIESLDPGYQFGNVQLNYAGGGAEEWRGNLIMSGPLSGVTQCAYGSGEAFVASGGFAVAKWDALLTGSVKNGMDMLRVMNDDNTAGVWDAKIAQTEVLMQFVFQRLTDMYGDIPYTEAGKGYSDQIFYPVYDSQEDVYKGMADKLKTSRNQLLATSTESFDDSEDVIYGHLDDASRRKAWARLANSLLLRIGMRASSADAAWSKAIVEEAANHVAGLITSYDNTISALIQHSTVGGPWGSHENGSGSAINGKNGGFAYAFVGEEYLHRAQQRKDPRLFYVACQVINKDGEYLPWTGQTYFDPFDEAARPGQPWKPVVFSPVRPASESFGMKGMKKVNDSKVASNWFLRDGDIGATITVNEGKDNEYSYVNDADFVQFRTLAGVNPQTVGSRTAPTIVFGADETYYILAEANARGWNVPGTAESNLEKALELTFYKYPNLYPTDGSPEKYMEMYETTTGIKADYDVMATAYISTVGDATLETILTERWKSLFLNGYEAFALWNRSLVSITPKGISYSKNVTFPFYSWDDIKDAKPGVEVTPEGYFEELFHNGGETAGFRPRRLIYSGDERINNADNLNTAINRQLERYGNEGDNELSMKMWISK
ncbi:MAG: SusD/RagB family nutrient-binding outer membrane lipoprotein [Marinilabiliaceae bacterium]|nr:SusD/RagB family nutrient-binding outer membrane lipoprotein [Marinilabiliaceae bacterium]